ncbi:MAG: RnfABCDGE type electron transport complex subunit B [Thermodesulfobacteriota bacterium]|nr:RnfABCDGE type electron transport complex subunit B [Thermodesulfobacteriota bacterium]
MLESVVLMGGLGLVIGGALAFASKIFYVYVDPKVAAINDVLPGANCGGCGFPGCAPNAEAIVAGKSPVDSCVAAGPDVAAAIAELMGVSLGEKEPEIALPGCHYSKKDTDIKYFYDGIVDCRAAALVSGGMKVCNIGCLGFGTCVRACPFDALVMGDDGLPKVDEEKCTGCGTCERICPKNIIRLTSVTRRIMREYTEDECITPCQRACPTGINIREYIRLIRNGDNQGAVQVIKERNPFPTVIGRICPAPCEFECRRQFVDEPVAINHLKRFVCDIEMNLGKRVLPYKAPATGKKVAVIGGGVEGLSAAFFTARLGHEPTVFEATSLLGGLLRVAIPEDRLPQHVLDWDIEGILEMGVKVKTSAKAGRDFTVSDLLKTDFQAVFIASGGWDNRVARGDVADVVNLFPGGYLLIDLLRTDASKEKQIPCGKNVVIAGGGLMVPEAVKLCRQMGAESVTVLSRKIFTNSSLNDKALEQIRSDGASVIYNTGITRVHGEDKNLTHIEYTELDSGIKHILKADTLFIASGRFPELVFVRSETIDDEATLSEENFNSPVRWEGVEIYKEPANRREVGLLSAGDVISGYSAAVQGINGGRKAAASIHNLMYGISLQYPLNLITKQSLLQGVNHLEGVEVSPRNIMPAVDIRQMGREELFQGFSEDAAVNEAERCLRCGLLCYERTKVLEEETA